MMRISHYTYYYFAHFFKIFFWQAIVPVLNEHALSISRREEITISQPHFS